MKLICDVPKNLYNRILKALTSDPYDMAGNDGLNFRTTEILDPPLVRSLWHDNLNSDELVVYASDYIFMQFGTAFHMLCEGPDTDTEKYEYKMSLQIGETAEGQAIYLYGTADEIVIREEVSITDNKTGTVLQMNYPVRENYQQQLNIYRYLLANQDDFKGKDIVHLFVRYFLRDHNKTQLDSSKDYPRTAIMEKRVDGMDYDAVERLVCDKVTDHIENPYRPCTPEERNFGKIKFKILHPDRTKAVKASWKDENGKRQDITTYEKAVELFETIKPDLKAKAYIEKVTEDIRCRLYCKVRSVCPYAKEKGYFI